ncbi:MAG: HD domain-containing protein [Actinomycetota bacterium]|jgi:uncharacterized protein|nr:HD domain-containing protein [Actinomycetota bacterium]
MWHQKVIDLCEEYPHPAWGSGHARRVLTMSLEIAAREGLDADPDVLHAAAFLHDLGAFDAYSVADTDHAETSADIAQTFLRETDFDSNKIPLVLETIRGHMFYTAPGESNEARVFHDADVLDLLGAIGCARVLSIVGSGDWTPDLPAAINLLRRFSRELPGRLSTGTAMDLAPERVALMSTFLDALGEVD